MIVLGSPSSSLRDQLLSGRALQMWDNTRKELYETINLYLKMEGLPPSPRLLKELREARRRFILTGEEAYEGLNELERAPQAYES